MSISSRHLSSTAKLAGTRTPALRTIAQTTPSLRLRTRSSPPSSRSIARTFAPASVSTYRSYATTVPLPQVDQTEALPAVSLENTYDIVIIGAGNAGLALAATLLSKESLLDNAKVLLVEGGSLDRVREWTGNGDWENRVSSLTAANVEFLKSIGAWQYIESSRSCPVQEMLVWTSTPSSSSQLHFPTARSPMAYMTENTNLQRALLTQIERTGRGKIAIKENARVEEMRMSEGKRSVLLNLGGHGWVRGGVVVGADGPNSPVRAFSGIKSFGHSYPTHGIVATLNHRRMDTNNTAFQRFLPTGPLAFLPMSPTASTMVWSTRPELAAAYKAVGPEALCDLVNLGLYASEADLERLNVAILSQGVSPEMIRAESERIMQSLSAEDIKSLPPPIESIVHKSIASFPLKLSHAESYIGERTVLIGDAAHTVHPLAGQGLNMGLADVKALGETWEKTKKVGGDLGAYTAMLPYARERYPANHLLLSTTDKLHHVFGTRIPVINWARSIGMDVINELSPVKKALMERAGAQSGAALASKSWYETGADAMDGWKTVKGLASIAKSGAGQLIRNGARQLLEKTAAPPASVAGRRSIHASARTLAVKPPPLHRPGPPQLPRKEQAEFDALVKKAQAGGISLADAKAHVAASTGEEAQQAIAEHRDLRKKPKNEFEGEINPKTGEVGGPKRDPFQAGDSDWQYAGRVTDF